jgi:taurine dioxygenase
MSTVVLRHLPEPESATLVSVKPLNPTFAAEIENVDLSRPQSAAKIAAIRSALVEHKLLVFRDQKITPRQQRDFAANFGPLHVHPLLDHDAELPEIIVLNYDRDRPPEPDEWHTDVTFIQTPPLGSILYGAVIPEVGGDTLFADLATAYAALSEPVRNLLQGLQATHDLTKSFRASPYYGEAGDSEKWTKARTKNPPVIHPVVRTHPETGVKGLFVNEGFTTEIQGLSADESRTLLEFLIRHQAKPQFTYRHRWRTGDVLFWDNRITQHMVVADYWPRHRRMHRATILGDRPV